ncbi:putative bifunctional diguanylate cyclase/phosphodiesterase [Sphingomonas mucosissima]|uniref:Phytochrome-like protein cph2 n=1 Tax=Sphingomonas mucosissima TaxID=370959 RepID=A0A245ZT75_9SPHN|nr:bifunctional diguanylate cyclase/phosphodiesterase [Sphingomonas mucosissima]OWK32948.1 phytochrome-like protein cph2 [Sphingomonas mucosissima]
MRLLIVDEDLAVHDAYRRSFDLLTQDENAQDALGKTNSDRPELYAELGGLECVYHFTVDASLEEVERSIADHTPFSVAFIGVSSASDLKDTVPRLRGVDSELNLVLVGDAQDFSPRDIQALAGPADKVFYLAGPFHDGEIAQAAVALGKRWKLDRELANIRAALARQIVLLEEQAAELAANESRALHLASHDPLTEAPNRLAFLQALNERARRPGTFAIAAVDLDRFRLINDSFGHVTGDEVVRETCRLLQSLAPEGGMVARLAGDEFGLLFDTAGDDAAVMACERVVAGCGVSMRVLGHDVKNSVSAGVVVAHESDQRDPLDLMRRADLALNEAKRSGRNVARLFETRMDEGIRVRRTVQDRLSRSIARGELEMLFQPIVANGAFETVGFEALLRWNTDEFGPISPSVFIPIAEESDLIHELGEWVLTQALESARDSPDQYVSVNFSPRQFRRQNFIGHVMELVQRAGIEPHRLQIEITETALFDDVERAAETLYRLRQMGFRVALDDFGTGYSNLYNVRKFPLDALKIDRSFIDGMVRERESAAIVRSITQLGRALKLEVIAEGVETDGQVALLRAAGASHLQGFLFSHPLRAEDARALVEEGYVRRDDDGQVTALQNAVA